MFCQYFHKTCIFCNFCCFHTRHLGFFGNSCLESAIPNFFTNPVSSRSKMMCFFDFRAYFCIFLHFRCENARFALFWIFSSFLPFFAKIDINDAKSASQRHAMWFLTIINIKNRKNTSNLTLTQHGLQ